AALLPGIVARAVAEAAASPDTVTPRSASLPADEAGAATVPAIVPAAPAAAAHLPPAPAGGTALLEDIVARVSPAVVVVETSTGRGSGVFVPNDTIITNAHVAGTDLTVRVRRAAGDTMTARVDSVARDLDLAVLKFSSPLADQPTVALGTSGSVRP